MTLLTRRIIYISLIVFFLVATPLVLFYSLGYGFDWQNKKLVLTGGFYLKSNPGGAKIYINNKEDNKTPRLISRLLPRSYNIKILKDGFHPWEKQLAIESRIVIEARNIFLVPEKPAINLAEANLSLDFSINSYFLIPAEAKRLEQANLTAKNILMADSYAFSNEKIFYLQPSDYILYKTDIAGVNKEQVSLNSLPADIYKIGVSPSQTFVFALAKSNRLFLFSPEEKIFKLLEIGVKNAEFSLDNKKLLYYTDTELKVMYLEKILIQPYKKAGEKELITRFAEKIKAAIWYPEDNEHIIFTVGNTIKITELDARDKRNTVDLLTAENFSPDAWNNPQMFYNTKKELLYFIDNNKLYSAQIKTPQPIIETNSWFD
jgi:hypothetical protein